MLKGLARDHRGLTHCYYLDVPLQETLARHATKPVEYLAQVTDEHLHDWYRERDLLAGGIETVIDAGSTLQATVDRIMHETGLDLVPPVDR
ncbi:kinase, partial [Streptomyces sp. NPDC002920]